MKKFGAESGKLLEMMINSVYTHKDIFLRELISNAADAIDKQYFKSLSGGESGLNRSDYAITIMTDKENRILTVSDNGCGMNAEEMEKNLGTIAHSDTLEFKMANADNDFARETIGQFGVGFYSAFMVAKKVEVLSRPYGSGMAYLWSSDGKEGYTVEDAQKETCGTDIILYMKDNTEDENYDEYLDGYYIKSLVKKYSDYIRYPIVMDVETFEKGEGENADMVKVMKRQTVNSMTPLWKKKKSEIGEEEADSFYKDTFKDYDKPLAMLPVSAEGKVNFNALLFVPSHAPFDFYSSDFKRGLRLYSNGVLVEENCDEILPEHFAFVKGVVDCSDFTLNVSRESYQHSKAKMKAIGTALEKKIKSALIEMMDSEREKYERFYGVFGSHLKYSVYTSFGAVKEAVQDLLLFATVKNDGLTSLKEYRKAMKEDQENVYYAAGKTVTGIRAMPQLSFVSEKGYDVLALTENVDEFVVKLLNDYDGKTFKSVYSNADDGVKPDELPELERKMLEAIKNNLGKKIKDVKATRNLKDNPVCFATTGELSIGMERVINSMPNGQLVTAEKVLEINCEHKIYNKLLDLYERDTKAFIDMGELLYTMAGLLEGMPVEDPAAFARKACELMAK